uniref:Uncharacterized protein n=1 Tax=Strongyloides stercoralis TaxID=6248 RepID=A0AAF5I392_STRER
MEKYGSEEALLLDGEVETVQQEVVEKEDSSFHIHLKYLRERMNTVEAVMSLKLMKEQVSTYAKRMLWCIPIAEAREQFLDKLMVEKKEYKGEVTEEVIASLKVKVKKSIKKETDYGIVDTTEGMKEMMQSIGKIRVLGCVVCVNGDGVINFPSLMIVPTLRRMKVVYLSGEIKGKIPENIAMLLNTLILECCGAAEQFCDDIGNMHAMKVIMILCRSFKCNCYERISRKVSEWFPHRLVIVGDTQYDGKALTHQISFQKRMMERKKGIVFLKGMQYIEMAAKIELPDDVYEVVKRTAEREKYVKESVDF